MIATAHHDHLKLPSDRRRKQLYDRDSTDDITAPVMLERRQFEHLLMDRADDGTKDRFIELAQAALEEADLEDERKGVLQEVLEALIAKTGAPLVAECISEQLRSQEVIERLAESHEEEEERRRRDSKRHVFAPTMLKEPPDSVSDKDSRSSSSSSIISSSSTSRSWLISEYIWRLFRILLLASLVGLMYHFLCAYHHTLFF